MAQVMSLTTLFNANNGQAGNSFDIQVNKPVRLDSFDVNLDSGTRTIQVWWRNGTADNNETNPAGWTLLGTATVQSNGFDNPTPVPVGGLMLNPGQVYGFIVKEDTATGINYTTGGTNGTTAGPNVFSNADMTLTTYRGVTTAAPNGGGTFFPRVWNGTVFYELALELSADFGPEDDCIAAGETVPMTVQFEASEDASGLTITGDFDDNIVGVGNCTVNGGSNATCVVNPGDFNVTLDVRQGDMVTIQLDIQTVEIMRFGDTACVTLTATPPGGVPISVIECFQINCPPGVDPNQQLGRQVHLPILNFQGQEEACDTWIEVQNIGPENAKAVLVTWAAPGFCPPQCAGPLKVECTGLLKPGSTWNLLGAQIPTGAKSGILFKFSARQLSEIGVNRNEDDIVADAMCETLFFGVVGDCDDYRRFKKAYNEGLDFGDIPQDLAAGFGALAVDVHRTCPADTTLGVDVTGKYNGLAGTHLGKYDPVFGGFAYYVPLIYADRGGFNSILYIQNGGLECASVEIWFKAQDDCLRARICEVFALAPGETFQFDASECVGPDWQGNAWVRTTQPTGIVVDIIGRDVLMTYVGEPAELNYTFDPDEAFFTQGNQVAYGPLIYSEYQGWDTGIQVQNLSSVFAAKAKVYFLDRSGDIITTLVDWVCPRGSQTFFLPVLHDLPGNWVGSVRVESQEWWSPGDPLVEPPNIVAVATLIKYNDAARTETEEAIAYNLLPEHKAFDWSSVTTTPVAGERLSGVGLIAIPSLLKDLDATGITSELAVANLVPKPGFTDWALFIYDQNGLLDYVCEKLNEKQVEYIDLQTWGYINPGFKGSAIISATFWEHDVFDRNGEFIRNLLGLAAVAVERSGTRLSEDVPGDEAAGARGIPFHTFVDEDEERFEFAFMGPTTPNCPGQPGGDMRPDPFTCSGAGMEVEITAPGDQRNLLIPELTTIFSTITVADNDVPAACDTIEDVDVRLSITHEWNADLDVELTSPAGTNRDLFTDICGQDNDVRVRLDDSATQSVGSVCPPDNFFRYDTEIAGQLQDFEGEMPFGDWVLTVTDDACHGFPPCSIPTEGELETWSLIFTLSDGS